MQQLGQTFLDGYNNSVYSVGYNWAIPRQRSEKKGQRQKKDFFLMKCKRE